MNLGKKRLLAAKTLKVGKNRILFVPSRISEIKEAITKQDIKDLQKNGAILLREIKGRRKNASVKKKRGFGNVRKKVNRRKEDYVIMTKKLRGFSNEMKRQGKISKEELGDIKKKIRNKFFKSKSGFKEYLGARR